MVLGALVKGTAAVASMVIATSQSSDIAARVLATAKKAFEPSGKPPPYATRDDKVSLHSGVTAIILRVEAQ